MWLTMRSRRLPVFIIVKTGKNQQVSDWIQISVIMKTCVTLPQEKETHFESPS